MKVLITARMEENDLQRLRPFFNEMKFAGWGTTRKKLSESEMAEAVQDADVAILEFEPVTEQVIKAAKKLKVIACCRNEPEANVDVEAATAYGITVISGAGRNAVSVAEFTFGLMLALSRHIAKTGYLLQYTEEITGMDYSGSDQLKGPSEWSLDGNAPFVRFGGPELFGKTLGIVGLGIIGKAVTRLGMAFGMKLAVYDPYQSDDMIRRTCNGEKMSLEQLMGESDFISLHAKVTEETKGLISERLLRLMKPSAYLINTARAAIMDYDALFKVCQEKKIAGAALDVFPGEPIKSDNPFRTLDNVVITPHLAGSSTDIPKHHSKLITDSLLQWFDGLQPERLMNPQVWTKGAVNRG